MQDDWFYTAPMKVNKNFIQILAVGLIDCVHFHFFEYTYFKHQHTLRKGNR